MIPSRIAAILLGIAVTLMAGAWQLQSSAGADLAAAQSAQSRETEQSDSEPPDPDDYRAILETLEHSIVIRKEIEVQLQAIEGSISSLEERQAEAADTATTARDALLAIAKALGGAADASNASARSPRRSPRSWPTPMRSPTRSLPLPGRDWRALRSSNARAGSRATSSPPSPRTNNAQPVTRRSTTGP